MMYTNMHYTCVYSHFSYPLVDRFGPTSELGLLSLTSLGFSDVAGGRIEGSLTSLWEGSEGTAAAVVLQGSRPMVAEVQVTIIFNLTCIYVQCIVYLYFLLPSTSAWWAIFHPSKLLLAAPPTAFPYNAYSYSVQ